LAEVYVAIASSFSANHNDSEALKYYHQADIALNQAKVMVEIVLLWIAIPKLS